MAHGNRSTLLVDDAWCLIFGDETYVFAPIRTHAVPWCLQVLKVLELGLGTIITCTPDPRVSDNGDWDVGNAKFLRPDHWSKFGV